MTGVGTRTIALLAALAVYSVSVAEVVAPAPSSASRTSVDRISVSPGSPSVPLRHAAVVPGSETIIVDGKTLRRDQDYVIDAAAGIVYLSKMPARNQSIQATYRYDPNAKPEATKSSLMGMGMVGGLGLNMLGGSQRMILGFGQADRLDDGTVLRSNIVGMQTKFGLRGGGGLNGVVIVSDQSKVQTSSLLDTEVQTASPDAGKGQAIMQGLELRAGTGSIRASYQNISKKFSSAQSLREAGLSNDQVAALMKERGLSRVGYGLQQVGSKSANLSANYDAVRDGKESIESRGYGAQLGGLKLNWSSEHTTGGFKRFNDLSNVNRGQLAKEAGMTREQMQLNYAAGRNSIGFETNRINSGEGSDLFRRKANLALGIVNFGFLDQRVEKGFTRFDGTRLADAGQLSREQGLRRQAWNVGVQMGGNPWSYSTSWIREDQQDSARLSATDVQASGRGWDISRTTRGSDHDFNASAALSDAEVRGHVDAIGKMYQANPFDKRGEEAQLFRQLNGISREGTRLRLTPAKNLSLTAEDLSLKDATDRTKVQTLSLAGNFGSIRYRNQSIGTGFEALSSLLIFERERLGSLSGLRRTDLDGGLNLGGAKTFEFSQTLARKAAEGELDRMKLRYADKGLELRYANRAIGEGFESIGSIADPEREFLNQYRGFHQSEFALKWNLMRGLQLETQRSTADRGATGESRDIESSSVVYDLDARTQLSMLRFRARSNMPEDLLYANGLERWSVARDMGSAGKVKLETEKVDYDGSTTDLPDSKRQTVAYETKINAATSLGAQHTSVTYSDGDRETQQSRTLTTALSPRTGVSVTDSEVKRTGDHASERQRKYGFWWDFGGGMRFSYNYGRQTNTRALGQEQSSFELTPGQVAGIAVGKAVYSENVWDRQRTQSSGNFQLSTVRPLQLGALSDLTLRYGADTMRDNNAWARENRSMGAGFRVGQVSLGWDYLSQVAAGDALAIDRTFRLSTDPAEKNPLRLNVSYKLRTMPDGSRTMIRNYALTARLNRSWELVHQLQTNPEVARGDVILGSLPQATRANKWQLNQRTDGNFAAGLSWEELRNDQQKTRSRVGGVNLTLNAKNPSPVFLFYGVEQNDRQGKRSTVHRYSLRYDQQPGPNQQLSLFLGNVSWQHSRPGDQRLQNWTMRMEYQLRF